MKLRWFGLALLIGSCALAQRGPGGGGRGGGGHPPGRGGGGPGHGAFRGERGAFRGGHNRFDGGFGRGFGGGFGYFGLPLSYPYYDDYFNDYPPVPAYSAPPPAPPQVIVEQQPPEPVRPVQPVVREYGPPSSAAPAASGPESAFAIVLKDGSVRSAAAVTAQDGTLHYVDPDGQHVRLPLDSVDRAATRRANRERGLDLQLPAPAPK